MPYNYYNHDGRIIASADVVLKLAAKKMKVRDAWYSGELTYEGNEVKFNLILDKMKVP